MPTFPILSDKPVFSDYTQGIAYDPSISSQAENGKIISRAQFTATKKKWSINYENLTDADKVLLLAFQDAVMVSANTFTWTNPDTQADDYNTSYTVRFESPLEFGKAPGRNDRWTTSFVLIED